MQETRLIDVPHKEVVPFIRDLSDAGCTGEMAAVIRKRGNPARAVAAWQKEFFPPAEDAAVQEQILVNGLFLPPELQLERAIARNFLCNWGFSKRDFSQLPDPPAWPADRLTAVVLRAHLPSRKKAGSVQRTFEEYWKWAAEQQKQSWRWDQLLSDPEQLRVLPGSKHEPGLAWEVIDLGASWDKRNGISPGSVRQPEKSPQAGILAAAALHPYWVRRMDGVNIPYVWLPGYQVTIPGEDSWQDVPCLGFVRGGGRVGLNAGWADYQFGNYAVPCFRE